MMRQTRHLILFIFLLLNLPQVAFAHAILVHSTPADQAIVHSRTVNLVLEFNSRIDAGRSMLTLTGPTEKNLPVQIQPSLKISELKGSASNLANGTYHLHWQVLATDGHITRGEITFSVAKR